MNTKYFCVLPWYSKEYRPARTTHCCLLPANYDIEKIRRDLLSGVATSACKKCWTIESSGQISRRQQENQFLDYKLNRDLEKIFQDCVENLHQDLVYQIYLSNLCNQACATCGDGGSTKWIELKRQAGLPSKKLQQLDLNNLDIDYANAKRIEILGGEPLFDPSLELLLSKLIDHKNYNCFVSFVTNGSMHLSQKLVDLFSQFSDLHICVSIDGIEKRFEYLRWPGVWDTLCKNLEQYKLVTNNQISVSYTISALNAIYYDETVQWFHSQSLPFNHNIVYHPKWLGLEHMPVVIKQQLEHHEFFKNLLAVNNQEFDAQHFMSLIDQQDKMKKISFARHLPELAALLTSTAS